jgi:streptomycin 6-kinase
LHQLPDKFVETIIGVHQEKGELWLKNFDGLIKYCEEKWGFRVQTPFSLSFNFVAPVIFADGKEAVLKMGVPSKEIDTEIAALNLYRGNGVVRLIESDSERGILLLERLIPGNRLNSIKNDEEATLLAASVMRKIKVPAPRMSIFPSVAQWAKGLEKLRTHFKGGTGPIPENMVEKAESLYDKLLPTAKNLHLLHGDLHHENIISAEREPWLAIDPKGLIGEPEYEVVSYLMNQLPLENPVSIITRRVKLFVKELQLNEKRILAWAYCHAILAAWWCIEDHDEDGAEGCIRTATLFDQLLKSS